MWREGARPPTARGLPEPPGLPSRRVHAWRTGLTLPVLLSEETERAAAPVHSRSPAERLPRPFPSHAQSSSHTQLLGTGLWQDRNRRTEARGPARGRRRMTGLPGAWRLWPCSP